MALREWPVGIALGRKDPTRNSLCKDPEAGTWLLYLRNSKKPVQLGWSEEVGKRGGKAG